MSSAGPISSGGGAAAVVQALDWKDAVETIADADIALTGEQTLKGLLTSSSRVGVIGQTDASENGIYVSAVGAWARAVDADTDAKVTNGMVFVVGDSGSTEVGKAFILTTPDPIVLDTTLLTFTLFVLALHAPSHVSGGSDAFLATDLLEAIVKRIQTSTGPTTLLVGAIADGQVLKRVGSAIVGAVSNGLPPNYIDQLNTVFNSVTSVRVGPGDARDKDDTFDISHAGLLTATITVSGAGGLDTGAEAADTWYAVHVIADSAAVNPVDALLSVSRTAPTLPAGYDKSRHVGWVRNDSSSNFILFNEVGNGKVRTFQYDRTRLDLRALNNGGATSMTTVDLSAFVPPNFPIALLQLLANSQSDGEYFVIAHDLSVVTRANQPNRFGLDKDTGGFDLGFAAEQIVDGGGDIKYGVSVGTVDLDIFVTGFRYILD